MRREEAAPVLYLVRHAHAVWRPDEQHVLSPEGLADAERVADLLAREPVGAIYSSPYPRARQTVEPLARRLGMVVRVEDGLRERRLAPGRVPDFEAAVRRAWARPDEPAHPGGESNGAALARAVACVERLRDRHPGGGLVLATHGSLLALLARHYAGTGFSLWERMRMPDVFRLTSDGALDGLWPG